MLNFGNELKAELYEEFLISVVTMREWKDKANHLQVAEGKMWVPPLALRFGTGRMRRGSQYSMA